ncbi:hypothetical protein K0M31_010819 [Melipona bicolor]|uniref:Uncharacterized protein n=1 Tax=Melipona bicolor TaxID=60889 RepID=A0AA40KI67_9HYME|nr:hypothetical protein K0M31_010819 [Melipona bicolor]
MPIYLNQTLDRFFEAYEIESTIEREFSIVQETQIRRSVHGWTQRALNSNNKTLWTGRERKRKRKGRKKISAPLPDWTVTVAADASIGLSILSPNRLTLCIMTRPPRTLVTGRNIPRDLLRENRTPRSLRSPTSDVIFIYPGPRGASRWIDFSSPPPVRAFAKISREIVRLCAKISAAFIAAISEASWRKGEPACALYPAFFGGINGPAGGGHFVLCLSYTDTLEFSYPSRFTVPLRQFFPPFPSASIYLLDSPTEEKVSSRA